MFIRAFFGVESRSVETPSVVWRILSTKPLSTHTNSVHLLLLDQLGCIYKILAIVKNDSKSSKAGTSPEKHIGQCLSPCITWEEESDKTFSSLSPIGRQLYFRTNANISCSSSDQSSNEIRSISQIFFCFPTLENLYLPHSSWNTLNRDLWKSVKNPTGSSVRNSGQKQKAKAFTTPNTDSDLREIHQNQAYACIWQF